MCGLLTTINTPISEGLFEKALNSLHHRGPDQRGTYYDENVQLGHTRLSIIGLDNGRQPLFNSDKTLALICNGEFYEFEKIRDQLKEKGHQFLSESDSEIVLHLYKEYGEGLFEHLRGEFAFVLYDLEKKKVLMARDRFGIKPLFFAQVDEGLVAASELKAVFDTELVKAEIDPARVRDAVCYFNHGLIFKNIDPIPPASFLSYDLEKKSFEIKKYWHLNLPDYKALKTEKSFEEMRDEVLERLDEAVRLRLRADVPVGVFLSGGIDSSAVISSIAKHRKDKFKAFSISFSEDDQFNESSLARKMAERVGAEYFEVQATKQKLLDNYEDMLWHTEMPTHNLHGVGKFLLSGLARQHVAVCLTGEGGDEVFLGYEYFKIDDAGLPKSFSNVSGKVLKKRSAERKEKFLQQFRNVRQFLGIQPMIEVVANWSELNIRTIHSVFAPDHKKFLDDNEVLHIIREGLDREALKGTDGVAQLQYFSIRHIMGPYILNMLGDRQEMANSLEGRTPLLDHHLFEYALTIPLDYKIKGNEEKYILKEATKDRVIKEIYQRQKWPYFAPAIPVRKGDNPTMDRLIDTYLSLEALEKAEIFDPRQVHRMMNWILPLTKPFPKLNARINSLLTTVLSVQILHAKFCA